MPKVNVRETNPNHYAQVSAEQEELKKTFASKMHIARLCPYCDHKIETLCRGSHGGAYIKCPNCGESVFFPPISFRRV